MSRNIRTRAMVLACLIVVGGQLGGCASSNANRSSRDASATLRFAEPKAVAEELADNLLANPRFQRAIARGDQVVIGLMEPVTIEGDDYTGDLRRKIDEFFEVVPEVFLQRGVGEFQQKRMKDGKDLGSDIEGKLAAYDNQDSNPEYDEDTGEETTGRKAKSVFAMDVVGKRDKVPAKGGGFTYDFLLRVKLYDVKRKTMIYSGSLILNK